MELKIFWTDKAKNDLKVIYSYFFNLASKKVAKSITKKIVERTFDLKSNPNLGAIEESLMHRKFSYRSIIDGNYKIIYFVDNYNIFISTVFDCRQNPIKLTNIN